jgi:hypothetical protein
MLKYIILLSSLFFVKKKSKVQNKKKKKLNYVWIARHADPKNLMKNGDCEAHYGVSPKQVDSKNLKRLKFAI